MPSSTPFEERPLLVLALGGNALSPPGSGDAGYAQERARVRRTGAALRRLADDGHRLLIVHGNGPQVGRLLEAERGSDNLDIHIAQTQGELGYLLLGELAGLTCVLTRVVVNADPGEPVKPVGPLLEQPPEDRPAVVQAGGWRVVVPSPHPLEVLEAELISELLSRHHVVAGGGGGIPVTADGAPVTGVIDKDRVASLLAQALNAERLLFATDVDAVYEGFGSAAAAPLPTLSAPAARTLSRQPAAAGSMGPKLESAADFAQASGRDAWICALDDLEAALAGKAGTRVFSSA